jgi:hypothetical protein
MASLFFYIFLWQISCISIRRAGFQPAKVHISKGRQAKSLTYLRLSQEVWYIITRWIHSFRMPARCSTFT